VPLQKSITEFINRLTDKQVINSLGLNGKWLLDEGDPAKVIYSVLLVENAPHGNLVRVQADNFNAPFDFNKSVKLELGSTAKLRTLTHYLEIIAQLHRELVGLDQAELKQRVQAARDPLTKWAGETLLDDPQLGLQPFLDKAMARGYSASPFETFFTGGGVHHFENFDDKDDRSIFELHNALTNSINLVFIRLMRDLVTYHRARLTYDANDVLENPANPERQKMLQEIAEDESRAVLRRAYQTYAKQPAEEIVRHLLGSRGKYERRLAILFFAWHIGNDEAALSAWLEKNHIDTTKTKVDVAKLFRAFHNPRLTLVDYAYLLALHPIDLWCASEFRKDANLTWEKLWASSGEARRLGSSWLLSSRNRHAQDLRLRIRIEKDAFVRMAPFWQRLGFPFKTLVPTYATAIGSSSDRPVALAELVGILVNDGVRRPSVSLNKVHFAGGTPYETLLEPTPPKGERVLPAEVARTVRRAMASVVEQGTARRLNGAFKLSNGEVVTAGGKTGSGDNRFETFNRAGGVLTSRATNRTATFVFYIGQRYFGVLTAFVQGREAANYHFTSALPVTLLKLLAPTINAKLDQVVKSAEPPATSSEDVKPGEDVTTHSISNTAPPISPPHIFP
ncbi:MAG TPA: penicillin-binding transpeptidase domain-containing protein, partial [Candidatus Binatia bacterium]